MQQISIREWVVERWGLLRRGDDRRRRESQRAKFWSDVSEGQREAEAAANSQDDAARRTERLRPLDV